MQLTFKSFNTEKDFDFVRIGQGDDYFMSDSVFFEWSGDRQPPSIFSAGNSIWVQLISDESISKDGFELVATTVNASGRSMNVYPLFNSYGTRMNYSLESMAILCLSLIFVLFSLHRDPNKLGSIL